VPRPTSYKSEYTELARKFCLLGADDATLAKLFDVSDKTIDNWKKNHPEFLRSLKEGKYIADAEVGQRLYERATGFEWDEAQAIKLKQVEYNNGKRVREVERVEIVTVHKVVPPDTTAIIFWLKNRQKANWRDKQEHEHAGKNGDPIEQNLSITYMPEPLSDDYFKHDSDNNGQ
jgi:hypothetical protein